MTLRKTRREPISIEEFMIDSATCIRIDVKTIVATRVFITGYY